VSVGNREPYEYESSKICDHAKGNDPRLRCSEGEQPSWEAGKLQQEVKKPKKGFGAKEERKALPKCRREGPRRED